MINRYLCSRIEEVEKKLCCSRKNITFCKIDRDYIILVENYSEYYLMSTWKKIDKPDCLKNIKKTYKLK